MGTKVTSGKEGEDQKKKKNRTVWVLCERLSTAATNCWAADKKKVEKNVFHCVAKTGSGDCGLFEKRR